MLVIFDLDDTLTDTLSSLRVARERVIRHFSHAPTTAALDRWQRASHFFDSEDFALVLPLVMPGLGGQRIDVDEVRRLYWACEIENLKL
jgi:phosphoglycolate phosphatase-like HAD superfamily hydrolase